MNVLNIYKYNNPNKRIEIFQMNKKTNNKNNKTTTKRKKFNWNFELNIELLKITKTHP
jgi:hypothetical protein